MKPAIICWWIVWLLTPAAAARARCSHLPSIGDREEAVLLFTSGSAGEPKGVALSHRNLLGNVSQFAVMLDLGLTTPILASLPFFHSFGCTVTLWYPLIEGVAHRHLSEPARSGENRRAHRALQASPSCSRTPTFLRGYLRKAEPEQLRSLRLLITGAEKLPADLAARLRGALRQSTCSKATA